MKDLDKMCRVERGIEYRCERTCELDEWIASAALSLDTNSVSLFLEKFARGKFDAKDRKDALARLEKFVRAEFGVDHAQVDIREEVVPNSISPHHVTLHMVVPNTKAHIEDLCRKVA